MTQALPSGIWPVMLTAFNSDHSLDLPGISELTQWYIDSGANGLFAVAQSSEMFTLSVSERLQVAAHVVNEAKHVPVVAAGAFAPTIKEQSKLVKELSQTGVKAVILLTNQFANENEDDRVWKDNISQLLELTDGIPLGLYECPKPYKRIISPELLGWCAQTGRFLFHKDTCLSEQQILNKILVTRGTPLKFYNAEMSSLLFSLQAGGDGFSGIAANLYPEVIVWLYEHFQSHPNIAQRLQYFLSVAEYLVENRYPTSAKYFLKSMGSVNISEVCRVQPLHSYDEHDQRAFKHLNECIQTIFDALPD